MLNLSAAGCSGVAVAPEELVAQRDGVAGARPSLHDTNEAVFTWAPSRKPLPFSHAS
jgi:hypothetical protein